MLKLSDLNVCSKDDFVAALANVFEHSPWVAGQAGALRPFAGVNELFAAMAAAVDRAPDELRLALIKAHPDLANKTQRAAGLTVESGAEQNSWPRSLSDANTRLSTRHHASAQFCFPYIFCVRRHPRSILRDFERRLPNDSRSEAQRRREDLPDRALRLVACRFPRTSCRCRAFRPCLDTHSGGLRRDSLGLTSCPNRRGRVVARVITTATAEPITLIGGRPCRSAATNDIPSAYFADPACRCPIRRFLIHPMHFRCAIRNGHYRACCDAVELCDLSGS